MPSDIYTLHWLKHTFIHMETSRITGFGNKLFHPSINYTTFLPYPLNISPWYKKYNSSMYTFLFCQSRRFKSLFKSISPITITHLLIYFSLLYFVFEKKSQYPYHYVPYHKKAYRHQHPPDHRIPDPRCPPLKLVLC